MEHPSNNPIEGDSTPSQPDAASLVAGKSASSIRRSRAMQIVFGEDPIVHVGGPIWDVPSQSQSIRYSVNMDRLTCECPFWRDRRVVCKHIEAVRIYKSRNALPEDGTSTGLPNAYKNPSWYDQLQEQQYDILVLLLRSLARVLTSNVEVKKNV